MNENAFYIFRSTYIRLSYSYPPNRNHTLRYILPSPFSRSIPFSFFSPILYFHFTSPPSSSLPYALHLQLHLHHINIHTTDGRIAPRSGLASKHSIDVGAGVIDADYRGPLKILLFNFSDVGFEIKEGDRIAQLVLERVRLSFLSFLKK